MKPALLLTFALLTSPAFAETQLTHDFNQDGRPDHLILDPDNRTISYFETNEANEAVLVETNTELLKDIPADSLTRIQTRMNGELGVFEIDPGAAQSWELGFMSFRGYMRLRMATISERDLSTGAYKHIHLDLKGGTRRVETGIQHGPHLFSKRNLTGATMIQRWFWRTLKDFSLP